MGSVCGVGVWGRCMGMSAGVLGCVVFFCDHVGVRVFMKKPPKISEGSCDTKLHEYEDHM